MSLGFKFQLTPAQTKLLVTIYAARYVGDCQIPEWGTPKTGAMDHFVSVAGRLISKGLVSHSMDRDPTFWITDEGAAVAKLIIRDAAEIVRLADGAAERQKKFEPKPAKRKVPAR